MKSIFLYPLYSLVLCSLGFPAYGALVTDKSVLLNDNSDRIIAKAQFEKMISGDLYIATAVNGVLFTFADQGREISTVLKPFITNSTFSGEITVVDLSAQGISSAKYPLYKVVVTSGTDPLNANNWVGGIQGLSVINFSIGLPPNISGDIDADGFPDDDNDLDGFSDLDVNKDGTVAVSEYSGEVEKGRVTFVENGCSESNCHSSDPSLNRNGILQGKDVNNIETALRTVPEMINTGLVNKLTETSLRDIATYLRTFDEDTDNPTVGRVEQGRNKYRSFGCSDANCHNIDPSLDQNDILKGEKEEDIREALVDVEEMIEQDSLNNLTDVDIAEISAYLRVIDNGGDPDKVVLGRNKYFKHGCADFACHTDNPDWNKNKIINGQRWTKIRQAIEKVIEMRNRSLESLTEDDLRHIAEYIKTF